MISFNVILFSVQARQYSTTHEADLVVIGSGPGGYVGAIKAVLSFLIIIILCHVDCSTVPGIRVTRVTKSVYF